MRRFSPALTLLLLVLLLLSACGGAVSAPTAAPARPAEPAKPASPDGGRAIEAPIGETTKPTDRPTAAEPTKPAAAVVAPAATTAPAAPPSSSGRGAAEEPKPAGAPVGASDNATRPAATAVPAATSRDDASGRGGTTESSRPCRDCPPPQPQPVAEPLRAGAVDDNAGFDEYLRYLRSYRGRAVWPVDVSERYLISVTDLDQRGVANGLVRVYVGQTAVFTGRTYAGGQTVFFPRASRDAVQAQDFLVSVEKDGQTATQRFPRAQGGTWHLTLDGRVRPGAAVKLDLLFLIDSTGSMQGEISKIQATLTTIASRITQLGGQPQIRFAGVTYRDRGDEYVTRRFGFTSNLNAFQGWLNQVWAGGGGDYPEALNEALHVAVSEMDWDQGEAIRLIFLVADAPPHLDYPNDYRYPTETALAVQKGIKLYTIGASGLDPSGEYVFRQLAQQTLAQYIFITRGGDERSGGGGPASTTNIQSPENNLDDVIVRIVARELRLAV